MMMILGMFPFTLRTTSFTELQRSTSWRHANNSRVGDMPAYQFVGRGEDTITLPCSIVPEFGMPSSLTALRMMADSGKSYPLISGTGKIYGQYVIDDLQETQSYFFKSGAPRKIEFTLKLTQIAPAGVVAGRLINGLSGLIK